MADIRIRVGVSLDSELSQVLRPLREEAKKTRAQISGDSKASATAEARAQLSIARDRMREESRLNREIFKNRVQFAREAQRSIDRGESDSRAARTRKELEGIKVVAAAERAAMQNASRERVAAMNAADRAQARAARAGGRGGGASIIGYLGGRSIAHGIARGATGVAGAAGRMASSIAGGFGIDFDVSSMVRRNVERDEMARAISNSAFQPGAAGAAGQRQNPETLQAEARQIGSDFRMDPTKALHGMEKFVEVAGDLDTARKSMSALAMISQATHSDLEHVAEAAGNVAVQLGDMPDKANVTIAVMRAMAGQGKLGAIELRDMAKQMAALAANASSFSGPKADTIAMMGVLAQEARQHGGAKSASEAAFSVSSFVSTFSKSPRVAAMRARGINPIGKDNLIGNPQDIITQMLIKTKGDPLKLNDMVKDQRAVRAVKGFANLYNQTPGDQNAKIAAVTAEFERLKKIAMAEGEVRGSAIVQMESEAAKAQAFQNQLDETTRTIQARLLPTIERLAPTIIQAVEAFGKVVEWSASNPGEMITLAIVGSVVKAGIGEAVARAIGLGAAGNVGAGAAGGMMGLGTLAVNLGIASLAIVGLGMAADQASKLWNELHPEISFAPGTSQAEKNRLLNMTPEQRAAETAASMNVTALENAGRATGKGKTFGPPTAEIDRLVNGDKLLTENEFHTKLLTQILGAQLMTATELQRLNSPTENDAGGGFGSKSRLPSDGITGSAPVSSGVD